MGDTTPFHRLRAAMTRSDPATVYVGNHLPQPEGPIPNWDPREIAVANVLAERRDLYEDLARPRMIVSSRLQAVLRACVPEQVQLLPVRVQTTDAAKEQTGFAILNALQVLSPNEARSLAAGHALFSVAFPREIWVSESLMRSLVDAKLHGLEFRAARA